ncbi:MAG: tRNA (N6-isopentenyl adenosine(37)-C2)-methylthiotransferase MiaB [Dethiobacteria bacterium]|jgi:tRNA-2-methylthio-N6-dimethylallyladenosine synthase
MLKRYYIATYGCQMNVYDSEVLAGHLESMGYHAASSEDEADVLIINTCAVRKKAEEKVFSRLGTIRELKKSRPQMIVALWGCMAQRETVVQRIKRRFKFVDLVSGPNALERFPALLEKAATAKETVFDLDLAGGKESLPIKRAEGFKAWIPISHGCNNYCSYCVVPYVRGPEISRLPENIINEVDELANCGFKEITLLGQNVNSYGKDLKQKIDFADLLLHLDHRLINRSDNPPRIRFMTSHPKDLSEKSVRVIAEGRNICEHIHLPIQSGSDELLKKMNRGYTRDYYLGLVDMIREAIPGSSITTDLIVGFPGENEEDFALTIDLMAKVRFDAAFIFAYSPRQGTRAAGMPGQVAAKIKKKRIVQLNELQNRIGLEKNQGLVGSIQEVLVEGQSKTNKNMFTGRTRTNKIVHFPSAADCLGEFIDIRIEEARGWNLIGAIDRRN